jgi:hypothetical protein
MKKKTKERVKKIALWALVIVMVLSMFSGVIAFIFS